MGVRKLHMKQTSKILSTYSADTFGVASSLFELGGMVIIHDASGCNSTYTTHDEPRWYDMDSMMFVSAISEMEAILGDDNKLISDIVEEASRFHPRFIAIAGTPIPAMTGFDGESVAMQIENETGIPAFGFNTTGMNTYVSGADAALSSLIRRFARTDVTKEHHVMNILGLTPLDFSTNGQCETLRKLFTENGWKVNATLAMNTSWESIENIGIAEVNLVVSSTGRQTAEYLKETFGTPYVEGVPYGPKLLSKILEVMEKLSSGEDAKLDFPSDIGPTKDIIIGEEITSLSLALALNLEHNRHFTVICPTNEGPCLRDFDCYAPYEEDIVKALAGVETVISDPIFRNVLDENVHFIPLGHEAFSGRIFRKDIPNLIGDISYISEKL